MNILGKRIQLARKKKGLKQPELANLIGITQQSLSDIERGRSKNTRHLEAFSRILDVSQAWLLGEDEKKVYPTKNSATAYRTFIPILEENDIIPWLERGTLPEKIRSINMSELPVDPSINSKTYLKDITSDSFVNQFFKVTLPNISLLAIVDPTVDPVAHSIVIALLADKKIKIRQFIKDGNEYFLRSFDAMPEQTRLEDARILGVVSGYFHKNINN